MAEKKSSSNDGPWCCGCIGAIALIALAIAFWPVVLGVLVIGGAVLLLAGVSTGKKAVGPKAQSGLAPPPLQAMEVPAPALLPAFPTGPSLALAKPRRKGQSAQPARGRGARRPHAGHRKHPPALTGGQTVNNPAGTATAEDSWIERFRHGEAVRITVPHAIAEANSEAIRALLQDEELLFIRHPMHPYDPNAIEIVTRAAARTLAWLPPYMAVVAAPLVDSGARLHARVASVRHVDGEAPCCEVWVSLSRIPPAYKHVGGEAVPECEPGDPTNEGGTKYP